jgi:hypothetical protein
LSTAKARAGVSQRAVTSPLLFNFYLTKLPRPQPGIKLYNVQMIYVYFLTIGRNIDLLDTIFYYY